MLDIDYKKIGLRVGLEIHQQLSTNKKLFCNCSSAELDLYSIQFIRKFRASKSELGKYDPAALFEDTKSNTIMYKANPRNSCLVEQDEEPPHEINDDAKKISLIVASSLHSKIFTEIHVMRKLVIDGSNTSGFQRTMLISQGGYLSFNGKKIGVQSICLEEDAAKLLRDSERIREYSLERLGIPLIEIALEPVEASAFEMKEIALTLGRLLRTTKKVIRGLGSIRQDVNISINNGGVVEIKGVQQLDQLEKVIEYEAKRQYGLQQISEKLKNAKLEKIISTDVFDVTNEFKTCESKIIQKALKDEAVIKAIRVRNFVGMFSYSPYEGVRLGKELGQLVRFFGIGGVFHSDELPGYGINEEVSKIQNILDLNQNDSFVLIAGQPTKIDFAINSIIKRIEDAKKGVPAETRLATQSGETSYLRPRPGSSRMYPETDIPPVIVTPEDIQVAKNNIPKSWDESLEELKSKYNLNSQLAEQIFDSEYLGLFEEICSNHKNSPNFVASILCSTITNLQRRGLNQILLEPKEIKKTFAFLSEGKISKESIDILFENIMSGKSKTIEDAIPATKIISLSEKEINKILDEIISDNLDLIKNQGDRSIGPLMGISMKKLRGKISGEKVNSLIQMKIKKIIN